jgi:hypothetical protein
MTGIYAVNENEFAADEVLSSYITNRPYSHMTHTYPHIAPSTSKDDTDITNQLDLQDTQKYPLRQENSALKLD